MGRLSRCFTTLQREGVCYEDSEGTVKVKKFEKINVKSPNHVVHAVKKYLKNGPMVGTFEVYGQDFKEYGKAAVDGIYVVNPNQAPGVKYWTHIVTITGFGIQAMCPLWEFQNTYGSEWRGAARGFGQIYAVHLLCLYGFTLL